MDANRSSIIRRAQTKDLDALYRIEQRCFDSDRLSRRRFKHWIKADHGILLVVEISGNVAAYGLVWCHKGTRLARLYSFAVDEEYRGQGIASDLLVALEEATADKGHLFLRLEVSKNNIAAITRYQKSGYRIFGEYCDYYADHSDALRMQKTIRRGGQDKTQMSIPWYPQTTEFTCGPASLMMAMAALDQDIVLDQTLELDVWREATTIFMTSGHGGCHPIGLALSACKRGFETSVFLNSQQPLFIDGVRSEYKKNILTVVHEQFVSRANEAGINIVYTDVTQAQIEAWLLDNYIVLLLISTYRLDGKKAPHWVTVTGMDKTCFYLHDPDIDTEIQLAIDCQYLPIARDDFDRMSAFGSGRLRTAVAIKKCSNRAPIV